MTRAWRIPAHQRSPLDIDAMLHVPVDEVKIQILNIQVSQALSDAFVDFFVVGVPKFRRDEDFFPRDTASLYATADFSFVAITESTLMTLRPAFGNRIYLESAYASMWR